MAQLSANPTPSCRGQLSRIRHNSQALSAARNKPQAASAAVPRIVCWSAETLYTQPFSLRAQGHAPPRIGWFLRLLARLLQSVTSTAKDKEPLADRVVLNGFAETVLENLYSPH